MAEQTQKIELPDYVQNLLKERAELRNDVFVTAVKIVLKVAELSGTALNYTYLMQHIVGARIHKASQTVIAELFLDNGMIVKALVTSNDAWINFESVMACNCLG